MTTYKSNSSQDWHVRPIARHLAPHVRIICCRSASKSWPDEIRYAQQFRESGRFAWDSSSHNALLPMLAVIHSCIAPATYRNLLGNTPHACLSNGNQQSHVELRLFPQHCLRLAGAMLLIICLALFQSRPPFSTLPVITQPHRPRKVPKLARQHNHPCLSVQRQSAISCGTSSLSSALSQIGWSDASHHLPFNLPITTPFLNATSHYTATSPQKGTETCSATQPSVLVCPTAISNLMWNFVSFLSTVSDWLERCFSSFALHSSNHDPFLNATSQYTAASPQKGTETCLATQPSVLVCPTAISNLMWNFVSFLSTVSDWRQHTPCSSVQWQSAISCGTSSLSSAQSQIGWSDASHHLPCTLPITTPLTNATSHYTAASPQKGTETCLATQPSVLVCPTAISNLMWNFVSFLSTVSDWLERCFSSFATLSITTAFLNATSHYTATSPQKGTETCSATQPSVLVCPTAISNLMWNFVSFLSTVSDWLERCFSSFALHSSNHDPPYQRY